jgi:hypothetical protein
MSLRTKMILGTLAGFAVAIGATAIGRGCDERSRERGRAECRERGGRFTELHGRQEGWSCTFPPEKELP